MRTLTSFALGIVTVLALGAAPAVAVQQARVFGKVTTADGQPIAGAKVVVTHREMASFRVEVVTDAKGDYALTLLDATQIYTYSASAEGYQPVSMPIKVPIGQRERHDFELATLAEAGGAGASAASAEASAAIAVFNEGAEAAQMGDQVTARAKFEESVGIDPSLGAAWSALSTLAYGDGDYAKAAEQAEKALEINDQDVKSLRIAIDANEKLGRGERAAELRARLIEADPKGAITQRFDEGIKAFNANDMDAAVAHFRGVLETDPSYAKAHYMLGICLVGSDATEAKQHLQTFLELAPEDTDAATARDMLKYL